MIGSLVELAEWDAFVAANGWRGGAALHVDTGMNRLGIRPRKRPRSRRASAAENHGITLLMSHLACAETPDHPLNDKQIKLFREIRMLYRGIPSSLANSSGIFLGAAGALRPGAAGRCALRRQPDARQANPMRPVVELQARIVQVRRSRSGETIGYGATWTASAPTRLAIVAVGYADGFLARGQRGRSSPAARRSSPASAARSPAASPWTCSPSTSPTCPTARRGAAISRP